MKFKVLTQEETEVYVGTNGHVVIAQRDPEGGRAVVMLTPFNAQRLVSALPAIIKEARETAESYLNNQDDEEDAK